MVRGRRFLTPFPGDGAAPEKPQRRPEDRSWPGLATFLIFSNALPSGRNYLLASEIVAPAVRPLRPESNARQPRLDRGGGAGRSIAGAFARAKWPSTPHRTFRSIAACRKSRPDQSNLRCPEIGAAQAPGPESLWRRSRSPHGLLTLTLLCNDGVRETGQAQSP